MDLAVTIFSDLLTINNKRTGVRLSSKHQARYRNDQDSEVAID